MCVLQGASARATFAAGSRDATPIASRESVGTFPANGLVPWGRVTYTSAGSEGERTGDVRVRRLHWLSGFQGYIMLILWLFYDRYGMGLFPFRLALIPASARICASRRARGLE